MTPTQTTESKAFEGYFVKRFSKTKTFCIGLVTSTVLFACMYGIGFEISQCFAIRDDLSAPERIFVLGVMGGCASVMFVLVLCGIYGIGVAVSSLFEE